MQANHKVHVIGAGLSGAEAAYSLATQGIDVVLHEMKPKQYSPAHKSADFAELVCSNSLGSIKTGGASTILKSEMALLGSVVLEAAINHAVPAGGALAVEREGFGREITDTLSSHPQIETVIGEVKNIPSDGTVIIASGPLTGAALAADIGRLVGEEFMYFYDAIAPVIALESINLEQVYWGARYEPESQDYLNIPLDQRQYENFVQELIAAEKVPLHSFEEPNYFESCLPIDVLAERGEKTLSFGPLKPVGLLNPRTGERPYAVVQLRRENYPTTMVSMVGCQNKLKYGEQKRIFRQLPGLENAEFVKLGSVHRNTYLHSPTLLNRDLSLRQCPNVFFAGLLTGVEGYLESAAIGILVALFVGRKLKEDPLLPPPRESMLGSLLNYLTQPRAKNQTFQPINSNFALLPPLLEKAPKGRKGRAARREMQSSRAVASLRQWIVDSSLKENDLSKFLDCQAKLTGTL